MDLAATQMKTWKYGYPSLLQNQTELQYIEKNTYLMHDWLLRTLDNHYMYLASLASKFQPFLLPTYLIE